MPNTNDPDWTFVVDDDVPDERPYVTGAVVRGVDLDDAALDSLIQLQEKLHATMGRKRAKGAIGIHDLTMLKGDVLSENGQLHHLHRRRPGRGDVRSARLRRRHDPQRGHGVSRTGRTYGDLVATTTASRPSTTKSACSRSRRSSTAAGPRFRRLPRPARRITGTDQWTIDRMCNIVCYALAARGGQVEKVDVSYADDAPGEYAGKTLERPDFSVRTKTVTHDRIESILGVSLAAARSSTTPSAPASMRPRLNLTTVWLRR